MVDALTVGGLTVRYDDVLALEDVTVAVEPGTSLAIIGPNGSGKSTLLRSIAGLVKPDAGTVSLPDRTAPAFVLQSTDVDRSLPISVYETIAAARYASLGFFGRFRDADRAAVEGAMARLDVADLARRQFHDLSGGQRQRVLVAQGLAQEAPVLLLDEPVTGLDVTSRATILDVIDDERADDRIVLVTTHDLDDAGRCDQVLLLDTHAIAVGAPGDVLTERHLREAFGGHFHRVGESLVLDDVH